MGPARGAEARAGPPQGPERRLPDGARRSRVRDRARRNPDASPGGRRDGEAGRLSKLPGRIAADHRRVPSWRWAPSPPPAGGWPARRRGAGRAERPGRPASPSARTRPRRRPPPTLPTIAVVPDVPDRADVPDRDRPCRYPTFPSVHPSRRSRTRRTRTRPRRTPTATFPTTPTPPLPTTTTTTRRAERPRGHAVSPVATQITRCGTLGSVGIVKTTGVRYYLVSATGGRAAGWSGATRGSATRSPPAPDEVQAASSDSIHRCPASSRSATRSTAPTGELADDPGRSRQGGRAEEGEAGPVGDLRVRHRHRARRQRRRRLDLRSNRRRGDPR